MGFWEWMGFENPRNSPKTEQPKEGLPQVTDNVRDSGQTFVFGRSNAGEQVDEKAAMQIPTVYACVRLLAESIAALPLHLYRVTDDNGNKEKARDHPLYKILYRQPIGQRRNCEQRRRRNICGKWFYSIKKCVLKPIPACRSIMKYEKVEAANIQKSSGSTGERAAKVWRGVRYCWHWAILKRWEM